jgi:hypothetical protein
VRRSLNLHSCTNKDTPTHTYPSSFKSFLHACTLARWHAGTLARHTPRLPGSLCTPHATHQRANLGGWRAALKARSVPCACGGMGAGFPVSAASGGGGLGRICGTSILVESEAGVAGVCRSVSPLTPMARLDRARATAGAACTMHYQCRPRRFALCHRGQGRHTAGSFHSAQAVPFGEVAGLLSERYTQVTRTVLSTCFMSFTVVYGRGTVRCCAASQLVRSMLCNTPGWGLLHFVTSVADFVSPLACLISSPLFYFVSLACCAFCDAVVYVTKLSACHEMKIGRLNTHFYVCLSVRHVVLSVWSERCATLRPGREERRVWCYGVAMFLVWSSSGVYPLCS